MTVRSRLWTDIDFERDGKQVATVNLPHSVTRSAYGVIPIPLAVIKNGKGPTLFFMAGNHGDEYEGQVVLGNLIRTLEPATIKGRVIVLPAANLPAAKAGARVSPLDGGNLNRAFPGEAEGGPTEQIAHYIAEVLMPLADAVIDLHAGGSSLDYLPFVSLSLSGNPDLDGRALAAARAFGAPRIVIWGGVEPTRTSTGPALARGIVKLGGEYGGCGVVSRAGVELVTRGVENLLAHYGLVKGAKPVPPEREARLVEIRDRTYYVYAPIDGVFVPACELGDEVRMGQLAGTVHCPERPSEEPVPVHFKNSGLLICKRAIGRVEAGDCLAHLAADYAGPPIGSPFVMGRAARPRRRRGSARTARSSRRR